MADNKNIKKIKKIKIDTKEDNKNDIEITEDSIDVKYNEERPGVGYEIFGSNTSDED